MKNVRIVLYADDDIDDISWVKDACSEINSNMVIRFVDNGKSVLKYLESADPESRPSLIVLDLNMPELDGKQTLKKLKSEKKYQDIPVAVVTTSSNKIDRDVCTRLGAVLFLIKPNSYTAWQNIVRELEPFVFNE